MILERRCRQILYRELEADEYFLRRLPPKSIGYFIDIGANVGFISILMKLLNPSSKVLAIEPHPRVYSQLVENVSNLDINTLNCAIGNGKPFYLFKERKTDLCNEFNENVSGNVSIQSKTLSEIILDLRYPVNDLFLKIDCEGGEYYILEDVNSEQILKQCKVIAIELHPKNGGKPKDSAEYISNLLGNTHNQITTRHSDSTINMVLIRKDFKYD